VRLQLAANVRCSAVGCDVWRDARGLERHGVIPVAELDLSVPHKLVDSDIVGREADVNALSWTVSLALIYNLALGRES
jgi:hypothetical protein